MPKRITRKEKPCEKCADTGHIITPAETVAVIDHLTGKMVMKHREASVVHCECYKKRKQKT